LEFQRLLFGDDAEAEAQEAARVAAVEQQKAYAEARKLAWEQGKPFPEDGLKWAAAHRELILARCRESYRENYPANAEWYLWSSGRTRARKLGCKVGRRGPIVRVYRRALHAPVLLCYWCKKMTLPGERHVDHIQPLASGGAHVSGNLCVTCAECNTSKGDRSPEEFRGVVAERRATNLQIAAEYFRRVVSASP